LDDVAYFYPGMVIAADPGTPLRVIAVVLAGILRTVVDRWPWGAWGDGGDD
jgi:hypothetical protein